MLSLSYRPAVQADLPAILRLLEDLGLTPAGVEEWLPEFLVATSGDEVVAAAGLERHGPAVLLRSVAVRPFLRGVGVGQSLVAQLLDGARNGGASEAYLLTITAEPYFARLGFGVIGRDQVPDVVKESVEFREACPASATVMSRRLVSL